MRLTAIRRLFRRATTPTRAERPLRALMRVWWLTATLALVVVAVLFATQGFSTYNPVLAGTHELTGTPVPAVDLPTIQSAALSCPALSGPKVAAQLMATGAFDSGASGGPTVDGLDPSQWRKWLPWPDADRDDRRANNIVALAHQTCELIGQVRAAAGDDRGPVANGGRGVQDRPAGRARREGNSGRREGLRRNRWHVRRLVCPAERLPGPGNVCRRSRPANGCPAGQSRP
ncbi:hypothetical protein [Fodinicola feengrottensis]|uniref:hypothetical protein n=1 Tax=Fodinicola feengrottensis TaxID=435914 RepID=UPI0013D74787|nr:hypothetical protein [Fodinicola feengrottensis]